MCACARQPETYVKLHDILVEASEDFEPWRGRGSAGLLGFRAGEQLVVRVGVLSRGWWLARSADGGPRLMAAAPVAAASSHS